MNRFAPTLRLSIKARVLASGSVKELLGNRKTIRLTVSDVEKAIIIFAEHRLDKIG